MLVTGVILRRMGRSTATPSTATASRTTEVKDASCQTETSVKEVGSQSMVTYKRKWQTPEFRCLPEYSHG